MEAFMNSPVMVMLTDPLLYLGLGRGLILTLEIAVLDKGIHVVDVEGVNFAVVRDACVTNRRDDDRVHFVACGRSGRNLAGGGTDTG